MVGVGTVLSDDPRLTCRIRGERNPLRRVLDQKLRTPPAARVVKGSGSVTIVCAASASSSRRLRLERAGAHVLALDTHGRRGWRRLMRRLGEQGLHEVMLEGGAGLAGAAIRGGMVNEITIFYNPRFIGGDGVPMLDSLGIDSPSRGPRLTTSGCSLAGDDLVWTGKLA